MYGLSHENKRLNEWLSSRNVMPICSNIKESYAVLQQLERQGIQNPGRMEYDLNGFIGNFVQEMIH